MTDTYTIEWESRDGRTHTVTAPTWHEAVLMYREVDVLKVDATAEELKSFREQWEDTHE